VRIELLEKLVFSLAVLAIVMVAALVGVFSFVIQQSSGISKEEEVAAIAMDEWLADARSIAQTGVSRADARLVPIYEEPVRAGAPGANGAKGGTPAPSAVPGQPDPYVAQNGEQIPQDQQVPGIPFIRKQPGVIYMPPQTVPEVVYQRYQGFNEAYEEALKGAGEFVDGRYKITWVAPDSLLSTKVGIQPGDQIISVNGHPVGNSMGAGRQLYDSLKGEKHFAVKVLRNGREVMLAFAVN
jgi:S1-C subfamily serine protease